MPSVKKPDIPDICRFLEWDSEFFGVPIGRITAHRLTPETLASALDWQRIHNIACLYFLAESSDPETIRMAEAAGFQFVDIRVTMQWTPGEQSAGIQNETTSPGGRIRHAHPGDIPALRAIAGTSYTRTRFTADPHFSPDVVRLLYETWIEKSVLGDAQAVWVSEREGKPAGYITCHFDLDARSGQIGLVGVDPQTRGLGLAKSLLSAAQRWFLEQGVVQVEVVTQGSNIAAQRLYAQADFLPSNVQIWYHRWFQQGKAID